MLGKLRATLAAVETKVRASTAATAVLGMVMAAVTWAQDHPESLPALPRWAQGLILLVAPPLVTAVSGYLAAHTPRPDLNVGAEVPRPPVEPIA